MGLKDGDVWTYPKNALNHQATIAVLPHADMSDVESTSDEPLAGFSSDCSGKCLHIFIEM